MFNLIIGVILEWRQCNSPFGGGLSFAERSLETYMRCWEVQLDDEFNLGKFNLVFASNFRSYLVLL